MNSKLYKLALWYIKKCNAKYKNQYKEKVESLTRLTYWNFDKYLLLYGCDAEWQIFDKYDVLNNAIQRLAEYENIGTVEVFKALKKGSLCRKEWCEWRKFNSSSCLFETSYNNISGMYRGFNFCPYCGKKIKAVE